MKESKKTFDAELLQLSREVEKMNDEVKPSIEVATQIAEALNISLDYLVGATDLLLDKSVIKKIQEIQQLDTENKNHLFALMDAFLRDYKAKQAYS